MGRKNAAIALLVSCVALATDTRAALRIVSLPRATMCELAAVQLPPAPQRETRHSEGRRHYAREHAIGRKSVATARITADATPIPAPPLTIGFASASSNAISPADATGAVSRTHIMAGSNVGFTVHTRNGTKLVETSLGQFWNAGSGSLIFYDPRVVYDATAKRWVAMAIRDAFAVMLAVSASDDPAGTWYRYQIAIDDCDFSRLALTRDTVLLSVIIGDSIASRILSIDKTSLYAGVSDPAVTERGADADAMLVHAPDSPVEYAVLSGNSELIVRRLDTGAQRSISAGFSWFYPFDDFAPQLGGNSLSMGYGDVQAAVMRDGWIYAVHRIGGSGRTSDANVLLWWKVDPTGTRPDEMGIIDSPAGTTYAYPSLAVNRDGGMVVSFCVLEPLAYPSAAFVYRDPAGRVSAPAVIRTGNAAVSGTNRWGDYTTVVTDPGNDRDFWIGQIYATRRSWETWWSNVKVSLARGRAVRH